MNVNDYVWVRLTDAGRNRYAEYWLAVLAGSPRLYAPPKEVAGWSKFQLHDLMLTFGSECYNGNPRPPFGTEIALTDPTQVDGGSEHG